MGRKYSHVHTVLQEKCKGHMTCMRNCPTQAIRVRNGKSMYSEELCIDCGTCISLCPLEAIVSETNPINMISQFKYKIVVPSPVLYSQFDSTIHPYVIHLALKEIGFDQITDLNVSTSTLAKALIIYMKNYTGRLPLISSHCPSMVRLIQVKYPDLVELIVPLDAPREVTAREIRKEMTGKLGLKSNEIGIFYIAPCPAKIVSILQPAEKEKSWFDAAFAIKDIFSLIYPIVNIIMKDFNENQVPGDFSFNTGWSIMGSISRASKIKNWLTVSGLNNIMKIFDDIENSKLRNIDFVEAVTCMLGCISGVFTVESPYIARANSIKLNEKYEKNITVDEKEIERKLKHKYYFFENPVAPRPTKFFDKNLQISIKRMQEIEKVYQKLKQIDCGCCGSPTCLAFAEDFIKGKVELTDCIFFSDKNK